MSCSLITNTNFLDPNIISQASISSELTNFEASNLYDRQQRSRIWRSGGYYKIESGSNTIVFRETTLTDLTATLTVGEYTTHSALAAEIKSALEAAGGSVYTVEQDATNGKWKITSDLAGGGGIFEIIWTDANSSGMAFVLGYSTASNDTGSSTYTADLLRIHTEEFILWDFGLPSLPTAFVAIGQRNEPLQISPSATINLEGNHTNNFSTAIYSETLSYDSDGLFSFNTSGLGNTYLRYWRLQIIDKDNSNGYVELGSVFLGSTIRPNRGAVTFPFSGSQSDLSDVVEVVGGQVYGNNRAKGDEFTLNWQLLTTLEKEEFDLHFKNFGLTFPFFVYLDTNQAFSGDSSYWLRFVRYLSRPQYSLISPNNWSVTMQVREAL